MDILKTNYGYPKIKMKFMDSHNLNFGYTKRTYRCLKNKQENIVKGHLINVQLHFDPRNEKTKIGIRQMISQNLII